MDFKNYFSIDALPNDKKYEMLIEPACKNIEKLLEEDEIILISGDFYGIQKFIFEGLSTKNASKVLRAKSAYIQIFSDYLAKYVCHKFNLGEERILSITAGKFEILASKAIELSIIDDIQKKVNQFFIKNFFGLAGVGISFVECKKDDFLDSTSYKNLREKVAKSVELKKFKKFNLQNQKSVLSYDNDINNQNLCPICNIRKGKNNCSICNNFVKLGEYLVKEGTTTLSSNKIGINIDKFIIDINIDNKIKFYVAQNKDAPRDFESLAKSSCDDLDTGIKALAVLKADVDGMGNFLKKSDITDSFENFYLFSNGLNDFFSNFVPKLLREKYRNSYTVFTGGDDLFIIGAWNEMLDFARDLQDIFKNYVKNKLTISFGIAIIKPSYPVARIAEITEKMLETSKEVDDKNAITLFGQTASWIDYTNILKDFKIVQKMALKYPEEFGTTFWYRLLEFSDMRENLKTNDVDIKNALWRSKVAYIFKRNIISKHKHENFNDVIKAIEKNIEAYGATFKMVVSEEIYKRRD